MLQQVNQQHDQAIPDLAPVTARHALELLGYIFEIEIFGLVPPGVLGLVLKPSDEIFFISGYVSRHLSPLLRGGGDRVDSIGRRGRSGETRQYLFRHQPDALVGLLMRQKAGAADKDEMCKPVDVVVDVHDLPIDRVGIAGDEDAAFDRAFRGDADQLIGRAAARACAPSRSTQVSATVE